MPITPQPPVALLEVDPDLATDLSLDAAREARRITLVPSAVIPRGIWAPAELVDAVPLVGRPFACMVVDGMVARHVTLTDRTCTALFGPRDLVSLDRLEDGSLPVDVTYHALTDARVALLDDHFLAAAQRFPRMVACLMTAATIQLGRLAVDRAISQLPRVEDRLLALFWLLADRWGLRRGENMFIPVPLTHSALGPLIGARRPTVTLGLRDLAEAGFLRRDPDGWVLAAESMERLAGVPAPRRRAPRRKRAPLPAELPDLGGRLAERIAALNVEVVAGLHRAEQTVSNNREIRDRINAARADRARAPRA